MPWPRLDPDVPLHIRSTIIELAIKYEMEKPVSKAIGKALERTWPQTFAQWHDLQTEREQMRRDHYREMEEGEGLIDGKPLLDRFPEPAAAIRLAHDFNMATILPAAYYMLASMSVTDDWDELHRYELEDRASPDLRAARWSLLDAMDMKRLLRGRESLIKSIASTIEGYSTTDELEELTPHCDTGACRNQFLHIIEGWKHGTLRDAVYTMTRPDPLAIMDRLHDSRSSWGLCSDCADALQEYIRSQQEYLWLSVPESFDLLNPYVLC